MASKSTLDELFRQVVRRKGRCEHCGKQEAGRLLHTAHIVTRKYLTVRWREENAVCLCARCHASFHDFPANFGIWLDSKFPGRREEIDRILQSEIVKPRDFPLIKERLRSRLDSLEDVI